jgi:glucose-6-phosphate isomerase
VTETINPEKTLFLVSSKSGTTTEPMLLYRYFRYLVEHARTVDAGRSFAAVTDPATPLASLGLREGFRRVFLNPPDIGGRYSVLSYFGLVPAAMAGIDIKALLERADAMREGCASCVPALHNSGFWLGTAIGSLAQKGHDKLTLVTSPALAGFGLWAEQLIAESTGKEGKGIVPVAGEPLLAAEAYGSDRLFVYVRLMDDDNAATDAGIAALKSARRPVVVLDLKDRSDLGAEFFRWEFATAVAGAMLGIHPFNQPDVQRAKSATDSLLKTFTTTGRLPAVRPSGSLAYLLAHSAAGNYLAVTAYIRQTPETDETLGQLRRNVTEHYHLATTLGYGPRYLHSTGQLHKGGPESGLFLQITAEHPDDIQVPGEPYTFGVVADAQAAGDLRALESGGRPVVRLHLKRDDIASLQQLVKENSFVGV